MEPSPGRPGPGLPSGAQSRPYSSSGRGKPKVKGPSQRGVPRSQGVAWKYYGGRRWKEEGLERKDQRSFL